MVKGNGMVVVVADDNKSTWEPCVFPASPFTAL